MSSPLSSYHIEILHVRLYFNIRVFDVTETVRVKSQSARNLHKNAAQQIA